MMKGVWKRSSAGIGSMGLLVAVATHLVLLAAFATWVVSSRADDRETESVWTYRMRGEAPVWIMDCCGYRRPTLERTALGRKLLASPWRAAVQRPGLPALPTQPGERRRPTTAGTEPSGP